jgi:CRISPR/Cas system Type II protein with McrA/HNH and RuvC-like nuclease domain
MQPPIHFTGVANADWFIFVVGAVVCLYWLRALRLAREGARLFLRNVIRAVMVFSFIMVGLVALRLQTHLLPSQEQIIAGFVTVIFFGRWQSKKRSRSIPQATRRAVIKRDLKGEAFDSEKHHIDHVWPFSRGGSHTTDNLRVIERKKNLRKGDKRPHMREMW